MSEGCRERGIILGGEEESEGSGGMEGKREREIEATKLEASEVGNKGVSESVVQ